MCRDLASWQVRRYQGKVYAMRALSEFDRNLILAWYGEPNWHGLHWICV